LIKDEDGRDIASTIDFDLTFPFFTDPKVAHCIESDVSGKSQIEMDGQIQQIL
jgi:hypothetical protein